MNNASACFTALFLYALGLANGQHMMCPQYYSAVKTTMRQDGSIMWDVADI
jgi:hypothetical protein